MSDTLRYIIAGILIFIIILLQPVYLKWLGYDTKQPRKKQPIETKRLIQPEKTSYNSQNNKHILIFQ